MVYWNRGLISSQEHLPTNSGTSGVYDLTSQQIYTSESQWPGPASSSGIVSSGLLMHLDAGDSNSYSGTGTTWSDLSGNGNHATLVNGPTYRSSDGGHFDFDGSNDNVTTNLQLPNRPYTVSTWVYVDATNAQYSWFITQMWSYSNSALVMYAGGNPYKFKISRQLVAGGISMESSTTVIASTWYNFCLTVSSTDYKLYVNGTLEDTATNSGNESANSGNIKIGVNANQTWPSYFEGKMSSVLVYNKALSATEVTQNFNAIKSRYGL